MSGRHSRCPAGLSDPLLPLPARAGGASPRAGCRAPARSSRIRSAAAKSRRRRAAWRSSISRSISSTGTGGCSSSARRSDSTPSTRSKRVERRRGSPGTSPRAELPGVDRGVERAHEVEHRAERGRPCSGRRASRRRTRVRACSTRAGDRPGARPPAVTASSRARKSVSRRSASSACARLVPGEVQLLAVVRRQQQIAQRRRPDSPCATMSGIV